MLSRLSKKTSASPIDGLKITLYNRAWTSIIAIIARNDTKEGLRMGRRAILSLSILALVLLASGGCGKQATVNVYNWGDYMDPAVLDAFEKETKIKVVYEVYSTNEELLAKLKAGGTNYDIIIPSTNMLEVLLAQNLLSEIDLSQIRNFSNLDPQFINLDSDPGNKYSVPYFWGTIGILYNREAIGHDIDSWTAMHDPKYAGKIIMFDSVRDTIGVTLKMLGYPLNSTDPAQLDEAEKVLIKQKPLLHSYTVDAYEDPLLAGDALLSMAWSGDAFKVIAEDPSFRYVLPKEGTNVWVDSMAIPKSAKNKESAYKFIDFILRPEIGAQLATYLGYSTPNAAARELLPDNVKNDPTIYPHGNVFENNDVQIDIKEATELYDRIWTEIKSH